MSDRSRRDAADRLMDAITDLGDDMILAADQPVVKAGRKAPRTRWVMIGISAAAVLLAGIISLGIFLGGRDPKEPQPVDSTTEAGTVAAVTEAGTEAGTVAGTQCATECVTECMTEAGTEESVKVTAAHQYIEAKTVSYASLAEMEQDADVILRAVRLDQEEPVWDRGWGYTLSQVRISRIYKDKTGSLSVDEDITVLENEVYDAASDKVYHIAGYRMMVFGDEYLLFLKKDRLPDGTEHYVSCGVNYGTVSTTEDGRYTEYPEGTEVIDPDGVGTDTSEYEAVWKAALNKYR